MPSWCSKIFYPYRLLLLFSLVVCLLQILIGVSFFSTFSSQQGSRKAPEPPDVPPRPPAVPAPDALAAKQAASLASRHPELHFPCNVTGKEAVSAVTRATSRQCKQELVDLVCALEQGGVYPTSLPRFCPSQVDAKLRGEHIGCYQDTFAKRLLQGHTVKLKETNSPAACVEVCSKYGFSFAGVQYGVECFCGNLQPEAARELEDDRCDMGCPGEEGETCGGYLTMEVLETGVRPLVPSKLGQAEAAAGPPVRIVYLLTVSGRAIRQVRRLIKRIYSPDHYILVHVDARQEFMHREVSKLAAVLPNLRMVQSRFSTIWGGASLLSMLLSALQELLAMEDWTDWDFVLNLSESDFPVKTQAELVTFLSANRGSNFVKSHGREQDKFIKKQGLDKTFHECDTHMWRLGGRSLPLGVQIDGGSDWICLNRDFARYVVRSEDELVTGLKTLFSYTLLPAESFFHTVLRNSAYCTTYIDNNLHLTNWKRKQGCKCQYKAIVDWCGCSPNDFLAEDWLKLEGTKARQLFFARKFEAIVHQGVVNRVEAWVEGEAAVEAVSRDSYWQNVFHHEDIKPSMDSSVITGLVNHVLSGVSGECRLEQATVLEVTSYALNSRFDSNLVHLEATDLNQPGSARLRLEVKMKHQPKHRQGLTQHGTRYQSMTVGTDFDPKELLFRNFLSLIHQDGKPALRFSFADGATEVFTIGWLDPRGRLVATNRLQVNDTSGTDSVAPALPVPLELGLWTAIAALTPGDGEPVRLVAKEKFMVVPSSGSVQPGRVAAAVQDTRIEQFITVEDRAQAAVETFSQAIQELAGFYTFPASCHAGPTGSPGCGLPACSDTAWSSRFPDPKAEIRGVSPQGELR